MKKQLFYFVYASLVFCLQLPADVNAEEHTFVRAYFTSKEMANTARELFEAEAVEVFWEENYMILMDLGAEDIVRLEVLGLVVVEDPAYDIHHNKKKESQKRGIPGYPSYLTVEETFAWAESVATALPDLAKVIDIGDSWEKINNLGGYDHKVLVIGNQKILDPKPKVFVCGAHHAREYATSELNRRVAKYLIDNYGKDPDVTWMVDYHEYHALFFVNPDGRKHAEAGQLWRKNTNTNYCASNQNKRGTDLNRNYDRSWGTTGSSDECSETFWGASAASEPEVQAVQNHLKNVILNTAGMGFYIDLHSYGEVMYSPSVASAIRDKFSFFNKYNAVATKGGQAYEYAYYVTNVLSALFELGTSFFQGCDYFENTIVPGNQPAILYALKACRDPKNIPLGPDALSVTILNKTLTATINDTRYNGSTATQNIAAAEYYIETPPWKTGATAIPMTAVDGVFDEKIEEVRATLGTVVSSSKAKVLVYVRGKDANNNWGPVSAAFYDQTGIGPNTGVCIATATCEVLSTAALPVRIRFTLPVTMPVYLDLFDCKGKQVVSLAHATYQAGSHAVTWDRVDDQNNNVGNGIYFLSFKAGNTKHISRIMVAN